MANRVVLNCRKISKSVTSCYGSESVTGMKFSSTPRGANLYTKDWKISHPNGTTREFSAYWSSLGVDGQVVVFSFFSILFLHYSDYDFFIELD
jgi:hypothetical protein